MKKKILKTVFSIIIIIICGAISIYIITDRAIKTEDNNPDIFLSDSWLEIPVKINDKSTFAIFDTGAQICVLNESSSDKFNVIRFPLKFIKVNNHK